MRLVVAAVGKPRSPLLAAAIAEYERRAARYWRLRVIEVREESARPSAVDLVREREGERLIAALGREPYVVACEADGVGMSSQTFAEWLRQERDEATRDVAFVLGGAYGLSDALRTRARSRLSLAPWTLPHELARLVLAEQLYRAGTIVRGEPYHK